MRNINIIISLLQFKPYQRKVELVSIELLHCRNIKARPLKLQGWQLSTDLLQNLLKPLIIEEIVGPEETDMKRFWPIEVAIMVVEDIHVLEFLSGKDFLLQQSPNELVGESNNCIRDVFCDFQVDDCDFLALCTLVQPCEVVDACDLKRVFDKHAVNVFLMIFKDSCESLACGVVAQDEFEESEMGKLMVVFSQELRRVMRVVVKMGPKEVLYLCDIVSLVRETNGKRGEVSKEGLILDDVLVLVSHPIFFYYNHSPPIFGI